jgi:hypothetical protein
MKSILILAVTFVTITVGAIAALAEVAAPGEPITVSNFGKKAAVTFDHALHTTQGTECASCHHKADSGDYKCGGCHKGAADGDKPKIKDALHGKDKGVCYSCHLAKEAPNKLKCANCHNG